MHLKTGLNIKIPAFPVDDPDTGIIGHQDIDLAADIDALGIQSLLDALADIMGNNKLLQAQLLENQIDFMSHISSSSYSGR